MENLIELIKTIELRKEKAKDKYLINSKIGYLEENIRLDSRIIAFSEVINECYLILNNSCVKPLDSRSPEGQGCQVGVSRPNDSQNPNSEQP